MQRAPKDLPRRASTDLKAFLEGRARLRTLGAKGSALELLEVLLADLENRPAAPASQSARNYRLVYQVTACRLVKLATPAGEKRETLQARVQQRIDLAPALQINHPPSGTIEQSAPKEKASSKANRLTVRVLKLVLADLKAHAEKFGHHASAWVVFYLCSASRIGWRPCEVQGARIEGDTVFIKTAKLRRDNVQVRLFPLDKVPENSRFAAKVICDHLPAMGWLEFQRWRNRLAEALSQSCDRLGIDRISLYACRHIAIQTWRAAGLSKAEIAGLAGHINNRTAGRHYGGRASRDWLHNTPLDQLEADTVRPKLADADHAKSSLGAADEYAAFSHSAEGSTVDYPRFGPDVAEAHPPQHEDRGPEFSNFDLEDFPVPTIAPKADTGGAAHWNAHKNRIEEGDRRRHPPSPPAPTPKNALQTPTPSPVDPEYTPGPKGKR